MNKKMFFTWNSKVHFVLLTIFSWKHSLALSCNSNVNSTQDTRQQQEATITKTNKCCSILFVSLFIQTALLYC